MELEFKIITAELKAWKTNVTRNYQKRRILKSEF